MSAPCPDEHVAEHPCAPEELDAQARLRLAEVGRERALAEASTERRRRRRALRALALTFVAVLIAVGLSAWRYVHIRSGPSDEMARRAAAEREIERALSDIQHRIAAATTGDNPEQDAASLTPAFAILESLESCVADGKANEEQTGEIARTRTQLNRAHRDLNSIVTLDRTRLDTIAARENDADSLARRYREAFAALGIEPNTNPAGMAANILKTHTHRERLLVALSNWRIVEPDGKKRFALAYLTRVTEARDSYRSRLRDALIRKDDPLIARLLASSELASQPPLYLCRLSAVLRSVHREVQAEEVLQFGLNRHPGDFWLNVEMGGLLLNRKPSGSASAREYFKAAVAIRPLCPRANYLLGVSAERFGHFSEATAAFRRAIECDAQFVDAHLRLSALLRAKDDFDGAIHHGRRAMQLVPNSPAPACLLAAAYTARHDIVTAIAYYRKALSIDERALPALLGLGELLREDGRIDEAKSLLKKAVDSAPNNSAALYQFGLALLAAADHSGAAAALQKAIDLAPQDPAAYVGLGMVHRAQGKRDEALRLFQSALDRDVRFALAYVQLGLDEFDRGNFRDAANRFQQAVDHDQGLPIAHFHLGRALLQTRLLNGALKVFHRAADLKPQWVEARFLLGKTAMELTLLEDGMLALEQAAKLCPLDNPLFGPVHIFLQRAKQRAASRGEFPVSCNLEVGNEEGSLPAALPKRLRPVEVPAFPLLRLARPN